MIFFVLVLEDIRINQNSLCYDFYMKKFNSNDVDNKRVLIRYDIDVPLVKGTGDRLQVTEDFRLKAGLMTLRFCLQFASEVILMGHIGRPKLDDNGAPSDDDILNLSVAPVYDWFYQNGFDQELDSKKLRILENLRFEKGEEEASLDYAKELASLGDFYINEAFASYRSASSTTVLPTLLPHAAGLNFAKEVENLTRVKENPQKPFVAIMGGAKVEDKLPVIKVLAKKADAVLVGGRLVQEINAQRTDVSDNVLVGKLKEDGFDIAPETTDSWKSLIQGAKMIVWNGPLGKFEDPKNNQSEEIAKIILSTDAETVIGGGDTITMIGSVGLIEKFQAHGFVSAGGGAMLKFLSDGTLPTIEVLD